MPSPCCPKRLVRQVRQDPPRPQTEPFDRQAVRPRVRDAHTPGGLSGIDRRLLAHRNPRSARRRNLNLEADALDLVIDVLPRGASYLEILDGFPPEQADDSRTSLARADGRNREAAFPGSPRCSACHVQIAALGAQLESQP